jgi:hypothetical protein
MTITTERALHETMHALADVPAPDQLADRALAGVSGMRRAPVRRRLVLIPAGMATAAAAVAIAIVATGSGTATVTRQPPPKMSLAAQVLRNASVTVAQQSATSPAAHQWFDTTFVMFSYGQGTGSDETW